MRPLFRLVLFLLLLFMFRAPLFRLQQTTRHFLGALPTSTTQQSTFVRKQSDMSDSERPTGPIATSGLELLTFGTPNGHKASIMMEEIKEAYGKPDYVWQSIHIGQNIQKEPWFTKFGPNGRIPVLIDHDNGDLGIMEGSAILSYMVRHFDPEHKLSFTKDPELSKCEQWVAWQHGGLGPMSATPFPIGAYRQGQANHFYRLAKERIPYPTQRYVGETERLYGILDAQLKDNEYLVGGKYSIADIASFSWVNIAYFSGVDLDSFPNLYKWWERISQRPAVKRGIAIPSESSLTNGPFKEKLKNDSEHKEKHEELQDLMKKAKEQYDYKYSSP